MRRRTEKVLLGIMFAASVVMIAMGILACGGGGTRPAGEEPMGETAGMGQMSWQGMTIDGAGASFPAPVYEVWSRKYQELSGLKVNYQSIGSGGGIKAIKDKTVDFGASDNPLTVEELNEAGLIQFPMVMGGVVPIVNIPGVEKGQMKLTPQVLADIFLGKIKRWNDPAITKINEDLSLPDLAITVVHRSDGSGTTWIFSTYLAEISKEWAGKVGAGKSLDWPAGVGGKKNDGVAAYVQQVEGSIGYVEYAYALNNNLASTLLENKEGFFVEPTINSFQSAAGNADWKNAPGYYMVLVNQPGRESWPITGASFILLYKEQMDAQKAQAMLSFFDWCYRNGEAEAKELHYVPMPYNVIQMVEETWTNEIRVNGNPVWPVIEG